LLQSNAILLLLSLGSLLFGAFFELAIFQPAGEEYSTHGERDDGENRPGIKKGVLER